jgi:hypothetical protein
MAMEGRYPDPKDFFERKSPKIAGDIAYQTGERMGMALKEFLTQNPDVLEEVPKALLKDILLRLAVVKDNEVEKEAPKLEEEFKVKLEILKNNLK